MMAEDGCKVCGASLTAGLGWCGQCYTPTLRAVAGPVVPERDPYPDDLRFVPAVPRRRPRIAEVRQEPSYSHWRGSPTTFGPLAKVVITLGVLLIGTSLVLFVARFAEITGRTGLGYVMLWAGAYLVAAVLVLSQVWKRGRVR